MNDDAIKQAVISLTAGPVQPYSEVLQALARPVAYDYDPAFMAFYEQVALRCSEAMRWPQPALILQAEPAVAIEAAAASAISPDDVVLNLVSGVYGKGFGYWSARYHKEMFELEVPYNAAINVEAVSAMLTLHPEISVVSVVHHDTPSGTLNPIHEIGAVVRDHGALLIVDAVSSFAGMDVHPADCHADIFITGPGKCLGGTPGVTFMAVSDKAWAHMAANPAAPRASILSLLDWQDAWQRDIPFPFTPSVAEINGLDAALTRYLQEGPEQVWQRHAQTARACRAGVIAMGAELWAAHADIASPTTTAVRVPEGISDQALVKLARDRYGVMLSLGRGDTLGKLIRIGHMGPVAEPIYSVVAVAALGGALRALGAEVDVAAGMAAAQACLDA